MRQSAAAQHHSVVTQWLHVGQGAITHSEMLCEPAHIQQQSIFALGQLALLQATRNQKAFQQAPTLSSHTCALASSRPVTSLNTSSHTISRSSLVSASLANLSFLATSADKALTRASKFDWLPLGLAHVIWVSTSAANSCTCCLLATFLCFAAPLPALFVFLLCSISCIVSSCPQSTLGPFAAYGAKADTCKPSESCALLWRYYCTKLVACTVPDSCMQRH